MACMHEITITCYGQNAPDLDEAHDPVTWTIVLDNSEGGTDAEILDSRTTCPDCGGDFVLEAIERAESEDVANAEDMAAWQGECRKAYR